MADNTTFNAGSGGNVIGSDDIGSVKFERAKLVHGADGVNDGDISKANPLPIILSHTGRTELRYYAFVSSPASSEALVTLTKSSGTGATSTGTSFLIPSGKRFKITSITYTSHQEFSVADQCFLSIRINTAGAIATTSTAILSIRNGTTATAREPFRIQNMFPMDGLEIPGDGTLQWGVTQRVPANSQSPCQIVITGYEY